MDYKDGLNKADEFISILTLLFKMENLKVGLKKQRSFKFISIVVYDGESKGDHPTGRRYIRLADDIPYPFCSLRAERL